MSSLQTPETDLAEPPRLRALRLLVTILTATMILGLLTIIVLIVITLNNSQSPSILPDHIAIPANETAMAFTQGADWVAVVTQDASGAERIRILDSRTGDERQVIAILPRP